jgi:hypothetical protein
MCRGAAKRHSATALRREAESRHCGVLPGLGGTLRHDVAMRSRGNLAIMAV